MVEYRIPGGEGGETQMYTFAYTDDRVGQRVPQWQSWKELHGD